MPHGFEPITEQATHEALEAGHTLITANRRLAKHCFRRYGLVQQQRGYAAWESPDVLPYDTWLRRSFRRHLSESAGCASQFPVLLEPHQELYVWEEIVREPESGARLLQAGPTAESAMEAWRILHEWHIPWREIEESAGPDAEVFLQWCRSFRERCRRNMWLDGARLPGWLADAAQQGAFVPPVGLILGGFDEIPPLTLHVLQTLQGLGSAVCLLRDHRPQGRVRRLSLPDGKLEAETAARWARSELERDPEASIGILVPALQQRRDRLIRALDGVLQPSRIVKPFDSRTRPYNISLGAPLGEHPLPAAAISMLRLAEDPVPIELLSTVLRCPYLGEAESELSPRAMLDLDIRQRGDPGIRRKDLLEAAGGQVRKAGGCPRLAERLQSFFETVSRLPSKQKPSAWARDFSRLLDSLGWPGGAERSLRSGEYQAMQSWRSALEDFSRLDAVARPQGYKAALDRLQGHCNAQPFQPESPEVPVQVMGVLESGGALFDKVWIMGLDSETWPGQPQPNPFLPARVQRNRATPHADANRELDFCRRVTRRMLSSAPEVLISHPERDRDRELLPSPLIREVPEVGIRDLDIAQARDYRLMLLRSARLEQVRDDAGPGVERGSYLRGGTSLFQKQALCPFRAFAEQRLGAAGIESPSSGLGPAERGVLVHAALDEVWSSLRTRDELLRLGTERTRAVAERAAERALRRMDRNRPLTMTPRFRELERGRLVSLILEWLEREKERPPFAVHAREDTVTVSIGGLDVRVAADRIDRLQDGRKVVLDYKTGRNSVKQWFDERMTEPQLPLYCVASGERVAGLAFGRVRKAETGFDGLTEEEGLLPGCDVWSNSKHCSGIPSWPGVLAAWNDCLEGIAGEIRRGEAAPEPARGWQTCRDCELLPLCRSGEERPPEEGPNE